MDSNSYRMANLANKSFSEILSDGFKLFFQIYRTIILPLILFQVILIILDVFLFTDFRFQIDSLGITANEILEDLVGGTPLSESESNILSSFIYMSIALFFLQNLLGAIIITIAMCSVSNYVFKRYMKEDISFIESFKSAFNKKILLVILIIGICLPISFLLFIPAIIVFGFYIFLVFTYNMKDNKIKDNQNPIKEAREIARGAFWKIIGIFIINVIFISIISFIYSFIIDIAINADSPSFIAKSNSWYDPATRNYGMLILFQIIYSIIDIVFAPLWICLLTALFSSLNAKRNLKLQAQYEYYPTRRFYQEQYPQPQESYGVGENNVPRPIAQIEKNFYCPFCGHFISSPKKFCPKCGENLSFMSE
ncbi:MAG: zinc ribbon domain-containing protein [Promethearchaeota archaeon]